MTERNDLECMKCICDSLYDKTHDKFYKKVSRSIEKKLIQDTEKYLMVGE